MTPEDLRKSFAEKRYLVFGEVAIQYGGMSPSDPEFDPYLGVAEEMDVPMGIHIGTGPPGAPYLPGMERYRARLHSALVLEDALIKHPKLRVYIMHAGWPMIDDLLAMMWTIRGSTSTLARSAGRFRAKSSIATLSASWRRDLGRG